METILKISHQTEIITIPIVLDIRQIGEAGEPSGLSLFFNTVHSSIPDEAVHKVTGTLSK